MHCMLGGLCHQEQSYWTNTAFLCGTVHVGQLP